MTMLFVAVPYLVLGLLGVTFLWGSLLAHRGRRWWATWLLVLGSGAQVLGAFGMAVAMIVSMQAFTASTAGTRAPSALANQLTPVLLIGGVICLALGFILFAAGFVGFCGRSGPTERRAAELEGMLSNLQERMNQPS